ncbi:hypothetical protein QBC41DRAFT_392343 [Cercophora samala]|uniref:Uncharacterized protein n=1 Tax=Cercophora samala TaxID=330535 RepID=A0AA39ZDP8_9PEZI|nr:hypothetical protein QBC41DRAFT_392343 [Cercophora samala]
MPPLPPDEYQLMTFEEWSHAYDSDHHEASLPAERLEPTMPECPAGDLPILAPVSQNYTLLSLQDVEKDVKPYPDDPSVTYQSDETVVEFVNRCRPSEQVARSSNWYIIRNPHVPLLPGRGGDRDSCLKEGLEIVSRAETAIEAVVVEKGRMEAQPLAQQLATDLIDLARRHGVTRGHWFFPSAVCRETLSNNLGDESRVESRPASRANAGHWLVQVSNRNFDDEAEVKRMMKVLRRILGVQDIVQLIYKPHVFGILGANKWNVCVVKYFESPAFRPPPVIPPA